MFEWERNFGAQSAMEYLMTYGWAILIIAVVLGALFALGVFTQGPGGVSCTASPGYYCQNVALQRNGTIGFQFGVSTGTGPIYNVMMACASTTNTAGYPNNAMAFEVVNTLGVAGGNVPFGNSISLNNGQTIGISNLTCYNTQGVNVGSITSPAPIGTPYTGFLWVNYTTGSGQPGTGNVWYTLKFATVAAKVV